MAIGYTVDQFIRRLHELRDISMHKGDTIVCVHDTANNEYDIAIAELVPCVKVYEISWITNDDKNDDQIIVVS